MGFLARFLMAWPESTQGYKPFTEAPLNWPHSALSVSSFTEILNQPVPINERGVLTPVVLPFTEEANAAWIRFHDRIESMLGPGWGIF
jgi:putative DNA primase/helicase